VFVGFGSSEHTRVYVAYYSELARLEVWLSGQVPLLDQIQVFIYPCSLVLVAQTIPVSRLHITQSLLGWRSGCPYRILVYVTSVSGFANLDVADPGCGVVSAVDPIKRLQLLKSWEPVLGDIWTFAS